MAVRIGTSGWHYKHWRGYLYPETLESREWLEYYSDHSDTVEISNSFYRLAADTTFAERRK
jgi:uncharacterized protein YecE (DUF72 family)